MSTASSPRPSAPPSVKFDADALKPYIKALLSTTFQNASWPETKDRDRLKTWMKEIAERVKERMLAIQSNGFKYIVFTQINENLGQGGRADMACHWEDSDTVAQEMFSNNVMIIRVKSNALLLVAEQANNKSTRNNEQDGARPRREKPGRTLYPVRANENQ